MTFVAPAILWTSTSLLQRSSRFAAGTRITYMRRDELTVEPIRNVYGSLGKSGGMDCAAERAAAHAAYTTAAKTAHC